MPNSPIRKRSIGSHHMIWGCVFVVLLSFLELSCGPDQGEIDKEASYRKLEFHIDWVPGADYIGYYVAQERGYYRDVGLDVTILAGNGAPQAASLIGAGSVQVGTTTGDALVKVQRQAIAAQEKAMPVAVAVIFPKNPVVLLSLAEEPVKSIEELEQKTLGYHETSVTYDQFRMLAAESGVAIEDIHKIDVGWGGAAELMQGRVDAVLAYTTDKPVDLELRGVRGYELWFDDLGIEVIGQVIAVPSVLLEEGSPGWVQKFVEASIRGWEDARRHPEDAVGLFSRRFAEKDAEEVALALEKTIPLLPDPQAGGSYINPKILKDRWQRTEEVVCKMLGDVEPRANAGAELFEPALAELPNDLP